MMSTSWSSGQGDSVSVSPLCSQLSCTEVPKEVAIFRKNHFLGPVGYSVANVSPYITFIVVSSHWCTLPSRAWGPILQSSYPAAAPPARTASVSCPVPAQDFGLVFAEYSEVHSVRPLLYSELSEHKFCLPACTTARSKNLMKTRATPAVWVIAEDAESTSLTLPLRVTPLITATS